MGVKKKSPWLFIGIAVLHFMETILIGVKTGVKYGKNTVYSIFMTLVFGFTWWLPLHKQMREETLTDDDFVRRPSDNPVATEKNKI
jgi:hypothetical protein